MVKDPTRSWILIECELEVTQDCPGTHHSEQDWMSIIHLKKMNTRSFAGLEEVLNMTERVVFHEILSRYLGIEVASNKQYLED